MGKIRVKTFGDEEQEKKARLAETKRDNKKAQAKAEAKRAASNAAAAAEEAKKKAAAASNAVEEEVSKDKTSNAAESSIPSASPASSNPPKSKKEKFLKKKKASRSKSYLAVVEKVDKAKLYKLSEALEILPSIKITKFDETVELHLNTTEQGVSGAVTLPHGTGKTIRVAIANQTTDPKGVEELVKKVEAGKIDFDVLIATPDAMPKLAKVARFLGPKGLMPNPKSGTVTPKPEEVAKKFEGGQMNFKTESKSPIIHLSVGKVSFGDKKLSDNIKTVINAVSTKKIKNATLKSTMSPGIKLDLANL